MPIEYCHKYSQNLPNKIFVVSIPLKWNNNFVPSDAVLDTEKFVHVMLQAIQLWKRIFLF